MRKTRIRIMAPKGYNRDFPVRLRVVAAEMGITPREMHEHKAEILDAWKNRPRSAGAHEVLMMSAKNLARGKAAESLMFRHDIDEYVNSPPEHEGHIGIARLLSGSRAQVSTQGEVTQPDELYVEEINDR